MGFLRSIISGGPAGAPFITDASGTYSRAEILAAADAFSSSLPPSAACAAVPPENFASALAKLVACSDAGIPAILSDEPQAVPPSKDLAIFTSGTTGRPKRVEYSWSEIFSGRSRSASLEGGVWFSAYSPFLYAGLGVFAQAAAARGSLICAGQMESASAAGALEASTGASVCATPSWMRTLISFRDCSRMRPARITLGGEPARQPLLDALKRTFPGAKISHIYATSELGECFRVGDGLEGVPLPLRPARPGVEFSADSGTLRARLESGAEIDTGDIVEISGGRMIFCGRTSETINVGGRKVSPAKIEAALEGVEGVLDLLARPEASSAAGEIPALDVVCAPGREAEVEARIRAEAAKVLDKFHRPRIISFVKKIEISKAGKKARRKA